MLAWGDEQSIPVFWSKTLLAKRSGRKYPSSEISPGCAARFPALANADQFPISIRTRSNARCGALSPKPMLVRPGLLRRSEQVPRSSSHNVEPTGATFNFCCELNYTTDYSPVTKLTVGRADLRLRRSSLQRRLSHYASGFGATLKLAQSCALAVRQSAVAIPVIPPERLKPAKHGLGLVGHALTDSITIR